MPTKSPVKSSTSRQKKLAVITPRCVGCGSCLKICPFGALSIPHGVIAIVDQKKCVGCGKCVQICPAGVIAITTHEEAAK